MHDNTPQPEPSSSRSTTPSSRFSTPEAQHVELYNRIMAERLPPIEPVLSIEVDLHELKPSTTDLKAQDSDDDEVNPSGVAMTKAEKQNAKKKRRKERERIAREAAMQAERAEEAAAEERVKRIKAEEETVSFRLFSSAPVQPVHLIEKKDNYEIPVNPRTLPLSARQSALRHRLALEAAAGWNSIATIPMTDSRSSRLRHLHSIHTGNPASRPSTGSMPNPPILIAQLDRTRNSSHPHAASTVTHHPMNRKSKSSIPCVAFAEIDNVDVQSTVSTGPVGVVANARTKSTRRSRRRDAITRHRPIQKPAIPIDGKKVARVRTGPRALVGA